MDNLLKKPAKVWALRTLLPGILVLGFGLSANAQLPQSQLFSVNPVAVKRGETVEVTVKGKDLDGPQSLIFSHPGITAEAVVTEDELLKKKRPVPGKFTVKVAPDVPPGIYDVSVVGRYGASNPGGFAVTNLPIVERDPKEPVFKVTVGNAFRGMMAKEKPESFVVPMKTGETATLACFARRLGSRLDGVLRVVGPDGKELGASSRSGRSVDPEVTFTAAVDGDHTVEFFDYTYNGGDGFGYLVEVRAGKPDKPTPAGEGFVQEDQSKDSEDGTVQNVNFPAKIAGRFLNASDLDIYEFQAGGDSDVIVDVKSDRLGELTDPVVLIERVETDKEGKETLKTVIEGDDWVGGGTKSLNLFHRDPSVTFKAGKDMSRYRVSIWNRFPVKSSGASYQLSISGPNPGLELLAIANLEGADPKKMEPISPVIRAGGATRLQVYAVRTGGFKGAIDLKVEGLPAGITAEKAKIPDGANKTDVLLRATDDAAAWSGQIKIIGEAQTGGTKITAPARYRTGMWVVNDMNKEASAVRDAHAITLSVVSEKAPGLKLDLAGLTSLETCLGGKLSIPIKMALGEGVKLKGNVAVTPVGLGLPKPPNVNIAADKKEGTLNIDVKSGGGNTYKAGEYVLILRGEGQMDFAPGPEAKQAAEKEKEEIQAAVKAIEEEFKKATAAKTEAAKKLDEAKKKLAAIKDAGPERTKAEEAVKAAETESTNAVKNETELKAKVDAGKKAIQTADQRIKTESDKLKPKAIKFASYSVPISLKLMASPIVATAAGTPTIAAGEKGDVTVKIERKYDFKGNVQVTLTAPSDTKGVKLKLPGAANAADGKDGVLNISVAEDSAAGDIELTATVKGNINGVNFQEQIPVTVNVAPKKG